MENFNQEKEKFSHGVLLEIASRISLLKKEKKSVRWILKEANFCLDDETTMKGRLSSIQSAFNNQDELSFFKTIFSEALYADGRLSVYKSFSNDPDLIIEFDAARPFERGYNVGLPQSEKKYEQRIDLTQSIRSITVGFPQPSERTKRKSAQRQSEELAKRCLEKEIAKKTPVGQLFIPSMR